MRRLRLTEAGDGKGVGQGHQHLALFRAPHLHDRLVEVVPLGKLRLFHILVQRHKQPIGHGLLWNGEQRSVLGGLPIPPVAGADDEQVRPLPRHDLCAQPGDGGLPLHPGPGQVLHLHISRAAGLSDAL